VKLIEDLRILMEEVPLFPKKSEINKKLPVFVEVVALAAYKALNTTTIKPGVF
jgi:hypothetical protein